MANVASTMLGRFKESWERTSGAQRWLVGGVAAAIAIAVAVGIYLNRPDWTVLVSQADPKDAAEIVAKLQELKVPYQPSGDGYTILVPRTEQYTAKLALAQANLPHGTSVGLESFDQPKFGATDFERRINYLRGQQGELERALTRINEIDYANVKLAIPEQSVFVRGQQPVTAAVLVQPKAGRKLSAEQVVGIINFMAGSVQGLKPENVTIVDQNGRMLSNAGGAVATAATGDPDPYKNQEELKVRYERSLQTLLEPVFGAGNVVTRVNLEVAAESSKTESRTVGNGAPKQTDVSRESAAATTPPTTTTTTPAPGTPPTYAGQTPVAPQDQWKSRTTTVWDVSEEKKVTVTPAGAVKRISVGIAVNRPDLTPDQVAQIKSMVSGATGATLTDISVTALAFTTSPIPTVATSTTAVDNRYLIAAVSLAALSLFFLVLFIRRRNPDAAVEFAGMPGDMQSGSLLNVRVEDAIEQAIAAQAAGKTSDTHDSSVPPKPEAKRMIDLAQLVEVAVPEDAIIIEGAGQVVDETPEVAASLIASWLRGG